jgi:broad specificity phosphatase PhoE
MTLILIRHGETRFNIESKLQGSLDSPLTGHGEMQAEIIGRHIKKLYKFDQSWSFDASPQGRARATANIVKEMCDFDGEINFTPSLREVSFGDWEGLTRREIIAHHDYNPNLCSRVNWANSCISGESYKDAYARISRYLERANLANKIIVSHGVTLSILRGIYLGLARDEMLALPISQNFFHVLENGTEKAVHA